MFYTTVVHSRPIFSIRTWHIPVGDYIPHISWMCGIWMLDCTPIYPANVYSIWYVAYCSATAWYTCINQCCEVWEIVACSVAMLAERFGVGMRVGPYWVNPTEGKDRSPFKGKYRPLNKMQSGLLSGLSSGPWTTNSSSTTWLFQTGGGPQQIDQLQTYMHTPRISDQCALVT